MKPQQFELYSRTDYFQELVHAIDEAGSGQRVMLATMAFTPGKGAVKLVTEALASAAGRGAAVSLIVDSYPLLLERGKWLGPLWYHAQLPAKVGARWRPVVRVLEELRAAGVRCEIINQPGRRYSNPYAGRSHIKYAVVGERAFVGGCNLSAPLDNDMMVELHDVAAADWIADLNARILAEGQVLPALGKKNLAYSFGKASELLLDVGVPRSSIILDRALALIDAARERVVITCQFFPNDVTARHLLAAHRRGVTVEIYYNHPGQHVWPNDVLHHGVVGKAKLALPASFFEHEVPRGNAFLHAKVIATEQGAMIGSHNYVMAGVRLGTAEITLLTHDPQFAFEVTAQTKRQLG